MAVRRRLVDEVKPDPALEKSFVFSRIPQLPQEAQQIAEPTAAAEAKEIELPVKEIALPEAKMPSGAAMAKAPLTTRIRADLAAALKRASLERQLQGVYPQKVHAILEEALEPWLRSNGHLP